MKDLTKPLIHFIKTPIYKIKSILPQLINDIVEIEKNITKNKGFVSHKPSNSMQFSGKICFSPHDFPSFAKRRTSVSQDKSPSNKIIVSPPLTSTNKNMQLKEYLPLLSNKEHRLSNHSLNSPGSALISPIFKKIQIDKKIAGEWNHLSKFFV